LQKLHIFNTNVAYNCEENPKKPYTLVDARHNVIREFTLRDGVSLDDKSAKKKLSTFQLIDWLVNGHYCTPVDKATFFPRMTTDRFVNYQSIHKAIEDIAADEMQKNGITL